LLAGLEPRRENPGQRTDWQPTSSSSRFNEITGIFSPAGNTVDPSAKIGRTREFITGVQHELIPNLAVGAEYVYRKYDRGTTNFGIGYEPGAPATRSRSSTSDRATTPMRSRASPRRTTRCARAARVRRASATSR
jgi:hypothetical protein